MKLAPFPASGNTLALSVHAFFDRNQDSLRHSARLLGGYESMRLVDRIHESLQSDVNISRRTWLALNTLRDLLHLENVGDPDRPEMGFFAVIDPNDPVVEEICLLTDGLNAAIAEWDTLRQRAGTDAGSDRDAA